MQNPNYLRMRVHTGGLTNIQTDNIVEGQRNFHRNGTFPVYYALLIFTGLWTSALISVFLNSYVPPPLYIKDEISNPNRFISEYAMHHLHHLASFGPKVAGSYENEILAAELLMREISYISQLAKPIHKITLDIQKPTGSYFLSFKPYGFTNYYSEIQNIIVKFSSVGNSSSSLLLNCHFDSVPGSPGVNDNGVNCAVMLEVLRVLSQMGEPLKHNVIFLFNGAEESPLKASHGFIAHHKWAGDVKAFINLDSAGAGGREVLFQAGPNHPWLVEKYAKAAPYPHGIVVGEELFQSGLVPSDTDFRVFRDFGKIPGLDIAHKVNGYVYHTSFDNLDFTSQGTVQRTGDNILSILKEIASSDELNETAKFAKGRMVYYDFLGLFMVYYSEFTGTIINLVTVIFSMYSVVNGILSVGTGLSRGQIFKEFLRGSSIPVVGITLSALMAVITALFLDSVHKTMSWYSKPMLIYFIYFCPTLLMFMLIPDILSKLKGKSKSLLSVGLQAQLYLKCVQLFWTVLLLIGIMLEIRSSFLLMLIIIFPTINDIIATLQKKKISYNYWLIGHIGSLFIPVTFIIYLTVLTFELFIPITGRIGPDKNPEMIISIFAVLLCTLTCSYLAPLVVLLRKSAVMFGILFIFYIGTLLAICTTRIGFPYSNNPVSPTPQRIMVFHTERVFHEPQKYVKKYEDNGFWLLPLDHNAVGTIETLFHDVQNADKFCDDQLVCGLPAFTARVVPLCSLTKWIPGSAPIIHNPTKLVLIAQKMPSINVRRLQFEVTGPQMMHIFISPFPNAKLVNWSFEAEIPPDELKWKNRPTHLINYAGGIAIQTWNFWFDLKVDPGTNGSVLDIALAAHYIPPSHALSPDFTKMLNEFPDWTHVTAWTSSYKSWQF